MIRLWFALLILVTATASWATPRTETKRGNKAAQEGQADDAMLHYKQALEQKGDSSVILYDLGNLMYQGKQFEPAEKSYLSSIDPKSSTEDQAAAFYNLGNTYFESQKYDKAAQAYVETLKRTPSDAAAKYNLELARRMLQQQQQPQKQDQQQQDQDQNKQDQQQQDQDKKDQQDQQKEQQDQQQQQQQQQDQQQKQDQQQPQRAKQMSPEEAERILNALLQNEQDALKQAKKVKVQTRPKREKDW